MMIPRRVKARVEQALGYQAAVAIIGPRQVGKTTLAMAIGDELGGIYLDLEDRTDRDKLADPRLFLERYEDRLVILDEIHRVPGLLRDLRGIIDRGRRKGKGTRRFLMLGSASIDLLHQSGESLAGRIAYVDMGPLDILELSAGADTLSTLWVRGGYPDSFLAEDDQRSLAIRKDFIRNYCERGAPRAPRPRRQSRPGPHSPRLTGSRRSASCHAIADHVHPPRSTLAHGTLQRDVSLFGPRLPAETLDRLWTMLAHSQAGLLNASKLAAGLGVSAQTVTRYIDLLCDLLLVRRLQPYRANVGKRLVKSPKVYVRDSGLTHALLSILDYNALAGHPVVGASWEGFVVENLLAAAPEGTLATFYRTSAGAEIDLVLELPGKHAPWAIEIKRGLTAKPRRGFHHALTDVKPEQAFVVYSGEERYPAADGVEAIGLREMAALLEQ